MTESGFSLHAVVPTSRFVIDGPLEGWSRISGDGTRTTHYVCAICKTRTHSINVGRPGLAIVRTGTLDNSNDVIPVVHMWTRRKLRWIGLPENTESYEEAFPTERLKDIFSYNLS
ncbi:GFA family protein [Cupriavidus gilardii]|nr:GFA family protein [Cupriavidus gilardii]